MRESFVYLIALKPIVLNIKHIVTNTNYGNCCFTLLLFFPFRSEKSKQSASSATNTNKKVKRRRTTLVVFILTIGLHLLGVVL